MYFQWEFKLEQISMGKKAPLTIIVKLRFQETAAKTKRFDVSANQRC